MEPMVSWGFAFKKWFIIFLWSIVWGIAGMIIATVISGGAVFMLIMNPSAVTGPAFLGTFLGIFAGILIGALVASIGNYATIVKITLESVEETKRTEHLM